MIFVEAVDSMNAHRRLYTDAQLTGLVNHGASRRYLTTRGLPAQNALFQAASSPHALSSPSALDVTGPPTSYVIIGWTLAGLLIGLDADSGEVVAIDHQLGDRAEHANADLQSFVSSIEEFDERVPFYEAPLTAEQLEQSALALRSRLAEIDATSVSAEGGFWDSLVFDVGLGDYSD